MSYALFQNGKKISENFSSRQNAIMFAVTEGFANFEGSGESTKLYLDRDKDILEVESKNDNHKEES